MMPFGADETRTHLNAVGTEEIILLQIFTNYTYSPLRGLVTFSCSPKIKSPKRRASPVRRHYLANSCGVPALLAKAGRLRNSRTISILLAHRAGKLP